MKEKTILMDEIAINRALFRLAHEILEKNRGTEGLVLVGIKTRGVPMAQIIQDNIEKIEGVKVPVGVLDITLYRDDLTEIVDMPRAKSFECNTDIQGKRVVLCDDVLYTGRTARAAMEAILKAGRPKSIRLAVLIDRGHRELPIRADYVGKNIPTSLSEIIAVRFSNIDGDTCVKLFE